VLNGALLCDSSLLIMGAKEKKSDVFSYLKKVKCEYLVRSLFSTRTKKSVLKKTTISLNKALLNTSSHLC